MNRLLMLVLAIFVAVLAAGCAKDQVDAPDPVDPDKDAAIKKDAGSVPTQALD